jgi:hypothetical protein
MIDVRSSPVSDRTADTAGGPFRVTESLTTDLSRISGSFVIARNTAFTYKGKPFDVKKIGHELGVRYVLEGSVQRGGSRMRVNVQLIDAETGNHLWAERPWPTSSTCRTRSSLGWRIGWEPNWWRRRRGAQNTRCVPIRWTSIFKGGLA